MTDFPLDLYNHLTRNLEDWRKARLRKPPASDDDLDDWKRAGVPVHGHMCDGLHIFQYVAEGCMPTFSAFDEDDEEGMLISGCDANHEIPFVYCPFCGVKVDEEDNRDTTV